jgi:hypothetical protein
MTDEKYIKLDKRYNTYEVRLRERGRIVYNRRFKTLEEAINKRDAMIKTLNTKYHYNFNL